MWRLKTRASELAPTKRGHEPSIVSPVRGLRLLRHEVRTAFEATIYEPVVCLILQGRKQTTFGEHTFRRGRG